MKVLVNNDSEAIGFCGTLQKIMRRIEESNLHDVEKTSFVIFLSKIRDSVKIDNTQGAECKKPKKLDGVGRIAKERRRQIEEEGWTIEHDLVGNNDEQCARAAACYALPESDRGGFNTLGGMLANWPWDEKWFKPCPKNRIHELEKSGALAAAEIDRLLAIMAQEKNEEVSNA
jgi:hypothetical protein